MYVISNTIGFHTVAVCYGVVGPDVTRVDKRNANCRVLEVRLFSPSFSIYSGGKMMAF